MTQKLTEPICFLTTRPMYEEIRKASERREVKVSHLLRQIVRDFLKSEVNSETRPKED